ncbi:MAG: hypothetical protein F4106_11575 [Gemmatimonadetes bacterium]|nr:hypothetical protein [Gemmatimonadota bacterium]
MNRDSIRRPATMLAVAVTALSLVVPQLAAAQRPGMGAGGAFASDPGVRLWNALVQRYEQFTEELGLTDAQAESVTALVEGFREENEAALRRYDEVMTQMRNRMRGGVRRGGAGGGGARPNRQGMRPGGGGLADLMEELVPAFETLHTSIVELLDEEQGQTLNEFLTRRPRRD